MYFHSISIDNQSSWKFKCKKFPNASLETFTFDNFSIEVGTVYQIDPTTFIASLLDNSKL